MKEQEVDNTQKGIRFDATFGQFLSACFLIIVMFVVPVSLYEYMQGNFSTTNSGAYTQASLEKRAVENGEGSVAGVFTSDENNTTQELFSFLGYAVTSSTIIIAVGIVFVAIALVLSGSLFYDFAKK